MEQVNATQAAHPGKDEDTKDTDPRQPGTRTMDPELRAMGQLARIVDDLELAAQLRVLRWLQQRAEAKMYAKPAMPASNYAADIIGRHS